MYQVPQGAGMVNGPLLHALSIPPHDQSAMPRGGMSPADTIASSLVSPTDSFASNFSPASSHGGPFTPADALRMMSLVHKDVPENVDEHQQQPDGGDAPHPFAFCWPGETLWANMEGLLPEDFNLTAIPPVELGLGQFEAMPPAGAGDGGAGCGLYMGGFAGGVDAFDYAVDGTLPPAEEYDFDDTPTPGGPDGFSWMFGVSHEQLHMNW